MDIDFHKKTKRLVIRPYVLEDYELWKETFLNLGKSKNKWDIGPILKENLTKSKFKKNLAERKRKRNKDISYELIAFDKKNGEIIGFTYLMGITRGIFHNAYLGYGVLNHFWGEGYGKELLQAVLLIAFNNLKVHRIEAEIEERNKRSIRLAKSVGFRYEGLSKKRLFINEEWIDIKVYAITFEDLGIKWNTK